MDNKKTVKLSELITWVKQEILNAELAENDAAPLFVIDEVTLEVNFVLAGEGSGGFDMVVVKTDAKVSEERVQKATIHLKSIIPPERLSAALETDFPDAHKNIMRKSIHVLLKGAGVSDDPELDIPDYRP